ncbi:O-acetyltransferase OatA [Paenibacillus sp. P1XP2]|nr:O-acetyltransferase OatA [Paenibacillus sp. P1XP2]
MSNQLSNSKRYMPGLDGLRTLALFFVVLYHLNVEWAREDCSASASFLFYPDI